MSTVRCVLIGKFLLFSVEHILYLKDTRIAQNENSLWFVLSKADQNIANVSL